MTKIFLNFLFVFQASSHSSFKSSPLPKLNPLEGDDIRRNSPALIAGLNQTISIKQELQDIGHHPGIPHDLLPVSFSFLFFKFIFYNFFCSFCFS